MSESSHVVVSPEDVDPFEMFAIEIDYEYSAAQVKEACDALGITEETIRGSISGVRIADWLEDKHNG